MTDLLILESPNKVKDVQKYATNLGFKCTVTATVGHMLDLPPMSEGAAIDLATMAPAKTQPRDGAAAERVKRLKDAIQRADRVIVATDPDREGEAIAAEVWSWIPRGRAWRATFEEITQTGVQRGLAAMRPELNQPAVDAATARRVVDRLAGWHATSVVFDKLRQHKGVSAGRLQSAALRLVVDRHRENTAFVPSTSYGIRARVRTQSGQEFSAKLLDEAGAVRSFATQAEAEAAFPKATSAVVLELNAQMKNQRPRPPFEATSWLQVAQKALALSVKDATAAIQSLFESGHTTYPRTDTVRVSAEAITWARQEISRRLGDAYLPREPWEHKDRSGAAVQGAHEAIRPTLPHAPGELEGRRTGQWASAYSLIEARFLASQAAARVVQHTTVVVTVDGAKFQASGQIELFDGWKKLLDTPAEEETEKPEKGRGEADDAESISLPKLEQAQRLEVLGYEVTTSTTKPKPLFTQAALVAELKRLGIGRPSTYPTIVPLLLSRGWVVEEAPAKKAKAKPAKAAGAGLPVLVPQPVAFDLADFLCRAFPALVDTGFTAALEAQLDAIEAGRAPRRDVLTAWWASFERELAAAQEIKPSLPERKDLGACPKCQTEGRSGRLRLLQGTSRATGVRYEFAACDADTRAVTVCGYTAPTQNGELQKLLACPECKTSMRPVRRKDGGHSWVCKEHGWFLADKAWALVTAPKCTTCQKPMNHREKWSEKGSFFWGCFEHKVFIESDVWGGAVTKKTKHQAH